MSKAIRNGIHIGVIFGIIIVFINLIGFTSIIPGLLAKLTGNSSSLSSTANLIYFIVFIILMGIWNGWIGGKLESGEIDSVTRSMLSGLAAGLVTGIISGIYSLIIGSISSQGIDFRTYLVGLSPDTISLFILNLDPVPSMLAHIGIFSISGLVGGLFSMYIGRAEWRKKFNQNVSATINKTWNSPQVSQFLRTKTSQYIIILIVFVLLFFLPRQWGSYMNYVMGTVGIYVLLGIGLNLITGWAGQLVLGYVAFFAIGAYTFALLTAPVPHGIEMNFWLALLFSILTSTLSGVLLGLPILNLRGDYLAIVTLGFGEIVRIMIKSDLLTSLTNGPKGVRNVMGPTLFGKSFSSDVNFMYLIILAVIVTTFFAKQLQYSRAGTFLDCNPGRRNCCQDHRY